MIITRASAKDHRELTRISFAAKRYWNYPEEYYEIWRDELTITPEYIQVNKVYTASREGVITGFYSIMSSGGKSYLDHMFIDPHYHKQGIGTLLMQHAVKHQKETGISELTIYVDPNAAGFYDKIGAEKTGTIQSNIKNRLIPVYRMALK